VPRIEAQPDGLAAAGGAQRQLAGRIAELSARVGSASSASGAAGDPAVSGAISDCLGSWAASLAMLSDSVGGLGGNLTAAGSAYTTADTTAVPAG
jgi:hypothetical protein